jgi:hypothetical protein
LELIVIGLVAGLSLLSYAMWKKAHLGALEDALAEERQEALLGSAERTIHTLRPGDVVMHLGADWLVEGVLVLDDDGRTTRLYRLADGTEVRWLGVGPNDHEPLMLREVAALGPAGLGAWPQGRGGLPTEAEMGAPEQLTHDGVPYRLAARANGRVRRTGVVGDGRLGERAWLYDYAGAGSRRLLALAWSERTDAFAGERVPAAALDLLPGDGDLWPARRAAPRRPPDAGG